MPSYCVICEIKFSGGPGISYHKFNFSNPDNLSEWTSFVRNCKNDANWQPSRWSSICHKHFLPSDFKDQRGVIRKHLKSGAIPTVRVTNNNAETPQNPPPPPPSAAPSSTSLPVVVVDINPDSTTTGSQCRLCTQVITVESNGGVYIFHRPSLQQWLQKFLPHLNILPDDCLTKAVCCSCFLRLEEFNRFSETAVKSQTTLCASAAAATASTLIDHQYMLTTRSSLDLPRGLKIKQEPLVNIKEENHVLHLPQPTCSELPEDFQNNLSSLLSDFCHYGLEITGDLTNDFINLTEDHEEDHHQQVEPSSSMMEEEINIKPNIISLRSSSQFMPQPPPSPVHNTLLLNPSHLKQEGMIDCDLEDPYSCTAMISNEHSYCKYGLPLLLDHANVLLRVKTEKKEELPVILPTAAAAASSSVQPMTTIPKIYIIDNALIKHKCDLCGGLYETKSMLVEHQRTVHDRFLCLRCNTRFVNFATLYFHKMSCCYRRGYMVGRKGSRRWHCKDCRLSFKSKVAVENHKNRRICSRILKLRSSRRKEIAEEKNAIQFSCGTCDKSFVRFSNLRQHHLTHSAERCFSCPLCEKTFKRSCGLAAHHRSFHLKLRPFQCETCKRKFALKADMRRCKHIVRQQSNEVSSSSRRRQKQVPLQAVINFSQ